MSVFVVIPVYNHAEALNRCLSSLEKQTLSAERIIVVDDGSSADNPLIVAKRWASLLPMLSFTRQKNRGASAARNAGHGELLRVLNRAPDDDDFVIFCDADITMLPECLQFLHSALRDNPHASYAYCSFMFGWKKFTCGPFSAERLRREPFITTTSLIRLSHFPGFDETLRKFQDWDIWLTMLERGHTGVWVDRVLFSAKPRRSGMSTWFPRFAHSLPWPVLGYMPAELRSYRDGMRIIKAKHHLPH